MLMTCLCFGKIIISNNQCLFSWLKIKQKGESESLVRSFDFIIYYIWLFSQVLEENSLEVHPWRRWVISLLTFQLTHFQVLRHSRFKTKLCWTYQITLCLSCFFTNIQAALASSLNCWQDDRKYIVAGCHNRFCKFMGLWHPKQMHQMYD